MAIDSTKPLTARIAVLTVSDTRSASDDVSGDLLVTLLTAAGHTVAGRAWARDDVDEIVRELRTWVQSALVDVVLSTGGTGITGRDVTPEAFRQILDKEIPGFGELFRMLSFQAIGTSAMQSRALAGIAGSTYLFALPGSPSAVRDAWEGILRHQLDSLHQPCSLMRLLPRLAE